MKIIFEHDFKDLLDNKHYSFSVLKDGWYSNWGNFSGFWIIFVENSKIKLVFRRSSIMGEYHLFSTYDFNEFKTESWYRFNSDMKFVFKG